MSIKILGAGISGLTAAINLSKAGFDVDVYEKENSVGSMKENAQMLQNWIFRNDVINEMEKCNIGIDPSHTIGSAKVYVLGHEFRITSGEEPIGYTVIRGNNKNSFERDLSKQAKNQGAEIHLESSMNEEDVNIIATGSREPDAVIYGGLFEGDFDPSSFKVFFDEEYALHSYSYLYPHSKNRATFVTSGLKRDDVNPKKDFYKLLKDDDSPIDLRESDKIHEFGTYANAKIPETAKRNDILLVGEAAGFQDMFLGFGMSYAICSGYLAAKSIIEDVNYDRLWKEKFLPDLKRDKLLRELFNDLGNDGVKEVFSEFKDGNEKKSVDVKDMEGLILSRKTRLFLRLRPLIPSKLLIKILS